MGRRSVTLQASHVRRRRSDARKPRKLTAPRPSFVPTLPPFKNDLPVNESPDATARSYT